MKSYGVIFKNPITNEKTERIYPKMAQFKTRALLCEFLYARTFLTDCIVVDIVEFDPQKEQIRFAEIISQFSNKIK